MHSYTASVFTCSLVNPDQMTGVEEGVGRGSGGVKFDIVF